MSGVSPPTLLVLVMVVMVVLLMVVVVLSLGNMKEGCTTRMSPRTGRRKQEPHRELNIF